MEGVFLDFPLNMSVGIPFSEQKELEQYDGISIKNHGVNNFGRPFIAENPI